MQSTEPAPHTAPTRHFLATCIVVAMLGTMFALACRGGESAPGRSAATPTPTETGPRTIPDITVRAADFSFDAPQTLDAGLVSVTLLNDGQQPHLALFARIADGKSFNDVQTLTSQDQDPSSVLEYAGGPGSIAPGDQQQVTIDLRPGNYVLLCTVRSSDGRTHYARGQIRALQVTPPTGQASLPPRTDTTVSLRDFTYFVPAQAAPGRQLWKVTNDGQEAHEMIIVRPAVRRTYRDVLAYFQAGATGPAPAVAAGGFGRIDRGKSGWLAVDLEPGTYALVCQITNRATGRSHAQLGMIMPLEVK